VRRKVVVPGSTLVPSAGVGVMPTRTFLNIFNNYGAPTLDGVRMKVRFRVTRRPALGTSALPGIRA